MELSKLAGKSISKLFLKVIPDTMNILKKHLKEGSGSEISFAQFRILANLNRGVNRVSDIAEVICVSQPAISKLVEALVLSGHVTRSFEPTDRRVHNLTLTPEGRRLFKKIKESASKKFEPSLEGLSSDKKLEIENALLVLEEFIKYQQELK